jgi:hypothetical protein
MNQALTILGESNSTRGEIVDCDSRENAVDSHFLVTPPLCRTASLRVRYMR